MVTITFQSVGSNPSYQDAILAGIEVISFVQIQRWGATHVCNLSAGGTGLQNCLRGRKGMPDIL